VFADACATCHGDAGEGSKKTPAVVGPEALKGFADDAALLAYLTKEMPKDDPGSLSDQDYADVIAWMRSK
jgi:cytochrome c